MEHVKLGSTGIEVSKLAFGSLTMAPMQAALAPERAAQVLVHAASRGVNFLDTAQLYDNYEYIRIAEKQLLKPLVIASKTYAYEKDKAYEAVEEARKRLDRDYIDIFMLHEQEDASTLRGHAEAVEELLRLKALGRIRAFGISTHHIAGVLAAAEADYAEVIHPLINKAGLGIADGGREQMEAALKIAYEKGKGIYTMKPLGGGNLFRDAAASLDYAFSFPYKHAVCIGMQSESEVDANADFCEKGGFSAENLSALEKKTRRLHVDDWCGGCGRCAERCVSHGMDIIDGKAVPNENCVLCGYCSRICPQWAIKIV